MKIRWSSKASDDLARLQAFLLPLSAASAARVMDRLFTASEALIDHPRLGERLDVHNPREVRHMYVGDYEMRYELDAEVIIILRIWHQREDR